MFKFFSLSPSDIPGLVPPKNEDESGDDNGEDLDTGSHTTAGEASTSGVGTKRKRNEDPSDGSSPAKQQKPLCRYGPKCYQKGRQHREQFDHPWVGSNINSAKGNGSGEKTLGS